MNPMGKAAFVGVLALVAACSPFGGASVFNCSMDTQCTPNGRCLTSEGLCVFPDPAKCPATGEVYGPHSGDKSGDCVGGGVPDAGIDAPTMCEPNTQACFQHAIETCRADGTGYDPAQRMPCAFTCTEGAAPACVVASNIPLAEQMACGAGTPPALAPATGTVTIDDTEITCSDGCGGGNNSIARTSSTANHFYCLASITIPAGVTVTYSDVAEGVTLFALGNITIDGTITFDGGNATGVLDTNVLNDVPGAGGPGGFPGGGVVVGDSAGDPGGGPAGTDCEGGGGSIAGGGQTGANGAGGGGGGGGNQGTGGAGGDGLSANGTAADGGNAGTNTDCSTADARPLVGGAGGGGGADGNGGGATVACGWPGGGGGGALQLVSRTRISGTGAITANGGTGYGNANAAGGAGGGGAGGMILLESPMVTFTGMLHVNGGTGGTTDAAGGPGASAANVNGTTGTNAAVNLQGGGGGGGGGGRIRINATGAACGANASPTASCTTGTLRAVGDGP
jgi:hypothetical protein